MKNLLNEFLKSILEATPPSPVAPPGLFSSGLYGRHYYDKALKHYAGRVKDDIWIPAGDDQKSPETSEPEIKQPRLTPADIKPSVTSAGQTGQSATTKSPIEPEQENPKTPDAIVASSGDEEEANARGIYDENDKFQRAVVDARTPQDVFDGLNSLADEERDLAYNGETVIVKGKRIIKPKVGAGGLIPSTGETLCTESQSAMINGRYDPAKIRSSREFQAKYELLKAQHKKSSREIEEIADMHGISLYNEDGSIDPDQFEECLQIMAEAEVWINQQDSTFAKTKAGQAFGKGSRGEEARRAWLQAAFHAGYSIIANGPAHWDRNHPARVLKANSRTDGAVQELLKRKRDEAKTPKERGHYENQLKVWEKFQPYHDTYMVYTDKNGRTSVYHISNKKSADLKDPHNNTSPIRRLKNFLLAATRIIPKPKDVNDLAQVEASKVEAKRIAQGIANADAAARNGVEDIDTTIWSVLGKLNPTTNDLTLMGKLFTKLPVSQKESEVGNKYFLELTAPNSASGRLLINAGVDVTNPQAVVAHILKEIANTQNPSALPKSWLDRIGLKYGTLAQRVFEKIDGQKMTPLQAAARLGLSIEEVNGIYGSEVMKKLATAKRTHAAGLEGVNAQFVKDLHELDGTEPGSADDNGPVVETYIRGTMQALHIDTYITNFDEDVQVESGGMGTKPIDVRNCMAKLSGFKGDITTSEGRRQLQDYLGKRLEIEPGSDAVYLLSEDEKTKIYIAKETWRQSGKSKKVASGFGDDLRVCLTKETARRLKSQ